MKVADLERVLTPQDDIIIELIPGRNSRELRPGNFAIGLKYNRYIAPAIKYNTTVPNPNSTGESLIVVNTSIWSEENSSGYIEQIGPRRRGH